MINLALIVVKQLWWRKRNFVPERLGDPGGSGPRTPTSQVEGAGPGSPIISVFGSGCAKQCCDTRLEAAIDRDQEASTDQVRSVAMGQPQGMGRTFVRSCPNISAEYQASARPLAVCDSLRAGAEPCKVLPQHAAECQASARTLAVCDSLRAWGRTFVRSCPNMHQSARLTPGLWLCVTASGQGQNLVRHCPSMQQSDRLAPDLWLCVTASGQGQNL